MNMIENQRQGYIDNEEEDIAPLPPQEWTAALKRDFANELIPFHQWIRDTCYYCPFCLLGLRIIGAIFKVIYSVYLEWHRSGFTYEIAFALFSGMYHIRSHDTPWLFKGGLQCSDWESFQKDFKDLQNEVKFLKDILTNRIRLVSPRPNNPPSTPRSTLALWEFLAKFVQTF